ncbi:YfhO family protein [candidate division WWE3 bacterium]|nr:YfhO family protein [candidate division WWE3 bacterium]
MQILLSLLLSILTFSRWFVFKTLTFGDWGYLFNKTLIEWFNLPFIWNSQSGLGSVNLTASSWFINAMFGLVGFLFNTDSWLSDKLIYMIPIAIMLPFSSYFLMGLWIKNKWSRMIGSIVYSYNTYSLLLSSNHLTLLAAYSIAPLFLRFFISLFDNPTFLKIILTALIAGILSFYDFRVLYILFGVCFIYYLFNISFAKNKIKITIYSAFTLVIVGLYHIYWILGLANQGSITENAIFSRGLFGSSFMDIEQSLTLFHPFWTGGLPADFIVQPIPLYLFLVPIIAFTSFMLFPKNKNVLFWVVISLVGIFLTKQESIPFRNAYLWLYHYLPGFNAFREASKFYLLISLGFSVLIAYTTDYILVRKNKILKVTYIAIVVGIFGINIVPLITGKIDSLFVPRTIDSDYQLVANNSINDNRYHRTLWVPSNVKWSFYSYQHPILSAVGLMNGPLEQFMLSKSIGVRLPIQNQITELFKYSYSDRILDSSSIQYIFIPTEDYKNNSNIFKFYGYDRQFYIDSLDNIPYISKTNSSLNELIKYENANSENYFWSDTQFFQLVKDDNLDQTYHFVSNRFDQTADFTTQIGANINSYYIKDVFGSTNYPEISNKKIEKNLQSASALSSIYWNTGMYNIFIELKNNSLNVSKKIEKALRINNKELSLSDSESINLYSQTVDTNNDFFIRTGNTITKVNDNNPIDLGVIKKDITIYQSQSTNLIENPSFEDGPWSDRVGDCNAYDDNANIKMEVVNDSIDGASSLGLSSMNHIACTGTPMIPTEPGEYVLSFSYKSNDARQAGYYLGFSNEDIPAISKRLPITSSDWVNFSTQISVKPEASGIRLTIYGYPTDEKEYIETLYDNFKLVKVTQIANLNPNYIENYQKFILENKSDYNITYYDDNFLGKNNIRNASFETGLWQNSVGDCNAYDDNGKLGFGLDTDEKSDGDSSLRLEATRHTACTGPGLLNVSEDKSYLFSFDYQSPNAEQVGYYLGFNDDNNSINSRQIPVENQKWNTFNKIIKAPSGATAVSLTVYGYSKDDKTNVITRYDNFHLIELPDIEDRFYLVSEPDKKLEQPRDIQFQLINPTLKTVQITAASTPFYLNMSEAYHPQWQAQIENTKNTGFWNSWLPFVKPDRIEDDKHYKLNNFLNGWYIDTQEICNNKSLCTQNDDGTYNIKLRIEFFPQRWFYLGLLISGTTLVACLMYLSIIGGKTFYKKIREHRAPGG